jgi:Co/Zn/Cd efflux system component
MAGHCCNPDDGHQVYDRRYRRILWAVLGINGAMFMVEIVAGLVAGSASLQADALDFFADAANYGISLLVAGQGITHRARAALAKGSTMALFGGWVLVTALLDLLRGTVPAAETMGAVGLAALIANAVSFALLWAYRGGDSNMRSVWLCSRNDVLGNLAVLLAAFGVFRTGLGWPDVSVAVIIGSLALQGAFVVVRHALAELREGHL